MLYRLNLYRGDKLIDTDLLQGASLADAKLEATNAVVRGAADRAQLRNNRGDLAFHYPAERSA